MQIEAKVEIDKLNRRLAKFQTALTQRATPNRAVAAQLYSWTIKNYDTEGGSIGGWEPLQERTIAEKKRIGKEKMLVRSGYLRASFIPFSSDDNAGIGSEVLYSKAHQDGDPARNLPARPMLPPRRVVDEIGMKVYRFYIAREVQEFRR